MKIYIGKNLLLEDEVLTFQIFFNYLSYKQLIDIYLIPRFFKEGCLFFSHQEMLFMEHTKTEAYNIVFPDSIKSIFNLFWFFQEHRFFNYSYFLNFVFYSYFIPANIDLLEHPYVEVFIQKTMAMLWQRREELSTFQYLFVLIFKFHSWVHLVFEPFDLTVASEGKQTFLTSWLNMNIKLFPFLFLLFLTGLPFATFVIKPLGFLSIVTSSVITPLIFLYLLLVFYIIKVYGLLFLRVFINLMQALHIRNIWQSYKYAWKLPFLISLSFYSLFLFSDLVSSFNLPFVIILFLFSNIRFFVFNLVFRYLLGVFFPFTRSISNFFQKRIDAEVRAKSEFFRLFSSIYGEDTFLKRYSVFSYYEDAFKDNFFYILFYYWVILVPLSLIKFVKPYFFRFVEVLKPYW